MTPAFGIIRNPGGERLDYAYHPAAGTCPWTAVLGHGVTGNRDRPHLVALAAALAAAGIPALRFSFAGNGASEGDFGDATIPKEVDDLGAVLDALEGRRLCYVGHSMGAAVGVLRASRDQRIGALVSLAGMVDTAAFSRREFGDVVPDQGCMWDEADCPLSSRFAETMARLGTVADRGADIGVPWLLVHGTADEVVPLQDAHDIMARAGANAELVCIPGATHVSAAHTELMVQTVVRWAQRHLLQESGAAASPCFRP